MPPSGNPSRQRRMLLFFHCVSLSVPWRAPGENGELKSVLYRKKKKSPPAAPKMRDGGTSHKLTALKSVSLQGTVCPCMQQIGLIILQLCDKGKVAADATRTPFFLLHQVWLHTSQQWLTILKPTTLCTVFYGASYQKGCHHLQFCYRREKKPFTKCWIHFV